MIEDGFILASLRVEDNVTWFEIDETQIPRESRLEFARGDDEAIVTQLVDWARSLLESAKHTSTRLVIDRVEKRVML